MSFNKREKAWLDKYEKRFISRGQSRDAAILIRNAVTDIDIESDPEVCADYELSYIER